MKRKIFLVLSLVIALSFLPCQTKVYAKAETGDQNIYFDLTAFNKHVTFDSFSICSDKEKLKKWNRNSGYKSLSETALKVQKMGFSPYTSMQFLFPGLEDIFCALEKKINAPATDATLTLKKEGKFLSTPEKVGYKVLREQTAIKMLQQLEKSNHIKIEVVVETLHPKTKQKDLMAFTHKKSQFSTWCGNSSSERKNNIALAVNAINGTKIEAGDTFSFNSATGARNEDSGYKKAKIIQNGTFVEGTGGGVCQVSTTLYNAALLAGLQMVEVHQHSLPVSYVEPSRDAMVSGSSADLVFLNNTSGPVFIKASFINDQDIIMEVYGEENVYNYQIESKITRIIPHQKDEIIKDASKATIPLARGQTQRISSPKNGCESYATLITKDKSGKIVSRQIIRQNYYAPTRGIVVEG